MMQMNTEAEIGFKGKEKTVTYVFPQLDSC
jgi:hypothetical protein